MSESAMIDSGTLDAAVARGLVTADQVAGIRALASELSGREGPHASAAAGAMADMGTGTDDASLGTRDPENLRFVRGFADIFVTIGIALVAGPAVYFGYTQLQSVAGAAAIVAVASWLLSEYFTRVRRMALPSIVLLAIFAVAAGFFFVYIVVMRAEIDRWDELNDIFDPDNIAVYLSLAGAACLTAVAVALYYARFRVPIAVAAGVAALTGLVLALLTYSSPDFMADNFDLLILAAGIAVFGLAMRFDMADPERVTRNTDIAFWLHLMASPMIVHPILSAVVDRGVAPATIGAGTAAIVLALFAVISLVSVVIDRRSFLVAGLGYAGFAFRSILNSVGVLDSTAPATLLILGMLILALSAGWSRIRAGLIAIVPDPVAARLPPTRISK
jgi:hypothetical protein